MGCVGEANPGAILNFRNDRMQMNRAAPACSRRLLFA